MKTFLLLFAGSLLFIVNGFSQQVSWGPEPTRSDHVSYYHMHETRFVMHESGLFGVFDGVNDGVAPDVKPKLTINSTDYKEAIAPTLRHWSPALKKMRYERIPSFYKDKQLDIHSFLIHGGDILVFQEFVNREKETAFLFYRSFDPSSLKPKQDLVKIGETTAKSRQKYGAFQVLQSKEDRHVVLISLPLHDKKVNKEIVNLTLFDEGMKVKWDRKVDLGFADDMFAVSMVAADEKGRVFLLGQEYLKGKSGFLNAKDPFQYWLIGFDESGQEIQKRKVGQVSQHISKASIILNQSGELVFMSAYSSEDHWSIQGIFVEVFDPASLESKKQFTRVIPAADLQPFMPKRQWKSGNMLKKVDSSGDMKRRGHVTSKQNILTQERSQYIFQREDGGYYFILEHGSTVNHKVGSIEDGSGPATPVMAAAIQHDDIQVSYLSQDLELKWTQRIAKSQAVTSALVPISYAHTSYAAALQGNHLHIFTNLHEKSLDVQAGESPKLLDAQKNAVPMMFSLTPEGKIRQQQLFKDGPKKLNFLPWNIYQLNEDEIMFRATIGYGSTIGKLTLPSPR